MKKVIVVYDDSIKPSDAIASITGKKSFGNTIFKRITLFEHMKNIVSSTGGVITFVNKEAFNAKDYSGEDNNISIAVIFSNFYISSREEFSVLMEKAGYAHENYKVVKSGKTACVIYNDLNAYMSANSSDISSYPEIVCDAFIDISDVATFRAFITSGFEARFFNSVSGDDYTVVKKSKNSKKLKAEHDFYYLLPDDMKQWFVRPFDYQENGEIASYKMERMHMADLAIRYVHGAISLEEFEDILNKLFYFIGNRKWIEIDSKQYEDKAKELYIDKLNNRIDQLKKEPEFDRIEMLIKQMTDYDGIDGIVSEYISSYKEIRSSKKFKSMFVVGHGDLCFSNILYNKEASILRLIDPKGATIEEELYTDPYYDLAKLSHSICGRYDFFNSNLYEIIADENLKAGIQIDFDNSEYVKLFRNMLLERAIDFRLVRLYECSLFLSMLPLHIDRPKKVFGFILNAIDILAELKQV